MPIICMELESTSNYFQETGEQVLNFGELGSTIRICFFNFIRFFGGGGGGGGCVPQTPHYTFSITVPFYSLSHKILRVSIQTCHC